jgi:N-acetylglucosamine kinase-like BadF-type ATPase
VKPEDFLRYYIGIDGGGTKTAFCAAGIDNFSLKYSETSGSSWREHGISSVTEKLKQAVNGLVKEDNAEVLGIAMGLPCYGESADGDKLLERAVTDTFAPIPVFLTNDVEIGWAGSMGLTPGINIVAGTGAIAFGKDGSGKTARSGGWSEFFGDEGSCYWVGRKVMEFFSKQSDGRMPRDELYATVRREFALQNDISFIDLMHANYISHRDQVAKLQLLAEKAALEGSSSAKKLYNDAAQELLLLAAAVRSHLDFNGEPFAVSYSGGLFKAGDLVLPYFVREIEKMGGRVSPPLFRPVEGAVLLAFEHFCPGSLNQIKKIIKMRERKKEQV